MRSFLVMTIAFQLIHAPVQASMGERQEPSPEQRLYEALSAQSAQAFSQVLAEQSLRLATQGAAGYLQDSSHLSPSDAQSLKGQLMGADLERLKWSEKGGRWEFSTQGYKIHFDLADAFQQRLWVNGKVISFKGVAVKDWPALLAQVGQEKTSWLRTLGEQFTIQQAQAMPHIAAAALVLAMFFIGKAIYDFRMRPQRAVAAMDAVNSDILSQAMLCENAGNDESAYRNTFAYASTLGDASALSALNDKQNALRFAMKQMISSGPPRGAMQCYQSMRSAGDRIGLAIPAMSEQQAANFEEGVGERAVASTDTRASLYRLCSSYNRLASCMGRFAGAHVNGGDLEDFSGEAVQDFRRYQQGGASGR